VENSQDFFEESFSKDQEQQERRLFSLIFSMLPEINHFVPCICLTSFNALLVRFPSEDTSAFSPSQP
jgi:hypothetical protein